MPHLPALCQSLEDNLQRRVPYVEAAPTGQHNMKAKTSYALQAKKQWLAFAMWKLYRTGVPQLTL
jgi:hypothetical protein